jgi:branched-chain amino acid transport system substrate-binding protein
VHDKTPYGQGLADETKKAMNAAGLTEVMYEGVNIGDNDFSALISKMKEAGVTVIYFGGLHTEGGKIVRQAADAGLKAQFISGDGIVSAEFATIAGPAAEGVLNTFGPDPRNNPAAADLVKKFRDAGFEPEAYTLYSYAAIQVIAQAIEKTGSADDAQKVAETIKSGGPWKTALGDLSYDEKGDRTDLDYVMYVWKKGADGNISYAQME